MGSKEPLLADRCQTAWMEWHPVRQELEIAVCRIVSPDSGKPRFFDLEFDPATKTLVLDMLDKKYGVPKRVRERLFALGINSIILMENQGKTSWQRPK